MSTPASTATSPLALRRELIAAGWLTIDQLAASLGISPKSVHRWWTAGLIPTDLVKKTGVRSKVFHPSATARMFELFEEHHRRAASLRKAGAVSSPSHTSKRGCNALQCAGNASSVANQAHQSAPGALQVPENLTTTAQLTKPI